ncbi:MAG: hypothetical protein KJ799_07060 [Bacteroidetes bacterium]|nr:hypothetical protein [Bacteroidota bacterium]MBU1680807.1 hypothetical protein [Bacteroidota bacterium]MBU2506466.1 hypothetical protein [Bacteroidota bacterium]
MSYNQSHAGIYISKTKLQVVEVVLNENVYRVEYVDEEYFSEFLDFSFKETKFISLIQSAYNEVVLRHPIKAANVSIALPNSLFKVFQVPIDASLAKVDLVNHLRWELSVLFPADRGEEYSIRNYQVIDDKQPGSAFAIVVAVYTKYLNLIHKFCERNNLRLKFIDNEHAAAGNLAFLNKQKDFNDFNLSLLLDGSNYSILCNKGKAPVYFRLNSYKNPQGLIKEIDFDLARLSKQLNTNMLAVESSVIGNDLTEGLLEKVRENTGLKLYKINPFEFIEINEKLRSSSLVVNKFNSFSSAAGMAFRMV